MKRKYPKVKGYWVYSIYVPSVNKYYIGVSKCKECSQRWNKPTYKTTALEPYLEEFDSMIKTVLVDNLTKEQSYQYEDAIIRGLQMNNLAINKQRSGLFRTNDKNVYNKQYHKQRYETDDEYRERAKQQAKQYNWDNKEKMREYRREYQRQYRLNNKEKILEQQRQRRLKKKLEQQNQ